MATEKNAKKMQKFYCEKCDFGTCNKSNFKIHLQTQKHNGNKMATNGNMQETKILQDHDFICNNCNKKYKDRTGLWKHKKTCEGKDYDDSQIANPMNDINYLTNIVLEIVKQNNELIIQNTELQKQVKTTNCNNFYNNTNNSHNKTFNLNVFLNETCKDAMNIMDFVNSIEIDLDDLEKVGELGYVNGMTNIILKNLKALDITKRPLHCTDVKREIMYVKDDDKWEKENDNKDKIKKALKYIIHKNAKMLNVFKAKYPDCIKSYSNRCDQYNKLVIEVLGGKGDNEMHHNEKIIRRIAREVAIDKSL